MLTCTFLPRHGLQAQGTAWAAFLLWPSTAVLRVNQCSRAAANSSSWASMQNAWTVKQSLRQTGTSWGLRHGKNQGKVQVKYCLIPTTAFSPKQPSHLVVHQTCSNKDNLWLQRISRELPQDVQGKHSLESCITNTWKKQSLWSSVE